MEFLGPKLRRIRTEREVLRTPVNIIELCEHIILYDLILAYVSYIDYLHRRRTGDLVRHEDLPSATVGVAAVVVVVVVVEVVEVVVVVSLLWLLTSFFFCIVVIINIIIVITYYYYYYYK